MGKNIYSKDNSEQIKIVLKNVISILAIVVISLLGNLAYEVLGEILIVVCILIVPMIVFVIYNYQKYMCAGYKVCKYVFDMFSCIFSVALYVFFGQYAIFEGFLHILLAVYFLTPFLLTCYEIGNIYQLGKQKCTM